MINVRQAYADLDRCLLPIFIWLCGSVVLLLFQACIKTLPSPWATPAKWARPKPLFSKRADTEDTKSNTRSIWGHEPTPSLTSWGDRSFG